MRTASFTPRFHNLLKLSHHLLFQNNASSLSSTKNLSTLRYPVPRKVGGLQYIKTNCPTLHSTPFKGLSHALGTFHSPLRIAISVENSITAGTLLITDIHESHHILDESCIGHAIEHATTHHPLPQNSPNALSISTAKSSQTLAN